MNNKLPNRKRTRLAGYSYSTYNRYFLTICTKDKVKILSHINVGNEIVSAHIRLSPIGTIVNECILSSNNMADIEVENYVIMPNHVHILLRYEGNGGSSRAPTPTNAMIPHYISTLKRFVNKRAGKDIWQRGYHDHIIRNEYDYKSIWNYIDNNPAKWTEDRYFI